MFPNSGCCLLTLFPYCAETSKYPNATFATFLVYCALGVLFRKSLPVHSFFSSFHILYLWIWTTGFWFLNVLRRRLSFSLLHVYIQFFWLVFFFFNKLSFLQGISLVSLLGCGGCWCVRLFLGPLLSSPCLPLIYWQCHRGALHCLRKG